MVIIINILEIIKYINNKSFAGCSSVEPEIKMKEVRLNSRLVNVAPHFSKTIWEKIEVGRVFSSVREMSKFYNIRNCNYDIEKDGVIIRSVQNGRMDCYGRRIESATYNF